MIPPTSVPTLMHQLAIEPGRPRLTWYATGDERVELSGRVLDNWVTKTANLLVEEYDVGPASRVLLDIGPHWRTVIWALATWRAGACVVVPAAGIDPAPGCDLVVTTRPDRYPDAADVIAVAPGPLARSWEGDLPPGVADGAAAVMAHADVLTWMPETEPGSPAIEVADAGAVFADLFTWAATHAEVRAGQRRLVLTDVGADAVVLAQALATFVADGSVVLCDPQVSAELAADQDRSDHLVTTERIDA